jgi:small-conductance mechanosensitive channel
MTHLIESLNISTSPYVNAAISIVVFVLLAKAADFFVNTVLRKLAKMAPSALDSRIIDRMHRPIFFTIIIVGLTLAVSYLVRENRIAFYTDALFYSAIALLWTVTAIKVGKTVIENSINRVSDATGLSKDIVPLIENISTIVIIIAGLMVILSIWKLNITPLLASAGIMGAGVALAAKDTIANFLGGISVFVDKPFKLGDFIVLDRGERGEVVAIGIRSTKVKTLDDIMITIPNAVIINSRIVNESAPTPFLRVKTQVGVAYGSDIDEVEKILVDVALGNANVIKDPAPRAVLISFGEYALNFEILFWIQDPSLRYRTVGELNKSIYKTFNGCGIKIPCPQRDVYIHDARQ